VTGASRDHEVRVIGSIGVASDAEDAGLGSLIVADISSAQQILAKTGKLTRIDLRMEEVDADALTAWLPQGAQLVATQEQRTAQQQMTRAFETNLLALSLLALLVGGFLIYNAMTFSVVRRRHQFGVMRAIGMTRRNILAIVIGEAVVIGIVASVLGLLLGWILAHGLLALVVTTINDLYYRLEVTRVEVKPLTLVLAFALGLLVSALAALLPALEASRVTPRMAMSRMTLENRIAFNDRRVLLISLTLIIGGLALVSWRTTAALWPAFGGLFLVMLGAASAVPWLMRVLIPPLAAGLNLWAPIVGAHASRALLRARSRTAIAVAALAIAMAATLGVSLMISSFRTAVDDWLRSYLVADIYLARDAAGALLSPKFRRELTRLDGARRVSFGRWTRIATGEEPVQLFALETNRAAFAAFQFIRGDSESIWPKFRSGAGIIISEPFANHRSLDVGDFLALPAATGNKQFEVVGVYRDYGSDRGIVTMDRHAYAREFADDTVTSAAVFMDDSVPLVDLMDTIRGLDAAPEDVRMRANRELRAASLTVFDRTFAVTGVIRTLAIIVAVIGIIVALMAIQYERANEFALLRALGMLPRDLWRLILTETGLMGVIAGIIALPVGIVTAWLLVAVINRRAFGWSMDFHLDVTALLACIGVSLLAALAAGLLPALHIIRTPPATALRYE
jgi:putative ABC transport system permease protein